ncbi:MAG: galactonate dehydratase [Bryobacterales bacterium]|nr:galactonate dehydratase [Bryobacterales bacterium]
MNRRQFFGGALMAGASPAVAGRGRHAAALTGCGCAPGAAAALAAAPGPIRITGAKTFGVTWEDDSDRPYVFVKLETDQGVVGWGEATLEGKAGAVLQTIDDLKEFYLGQDPMRVEHIWQSMYVHAFYRAGPILGSAIAGIDQALWDIRGKVLGQPVYRLLGGPVDPRGVRGYYHARANTPEQLAALRESAEGLGITAFKSGIPGYYEWIETNERINDAVQRIQMLREGLGDGIDIGIDFHAKTSPTVASIICREVEPLHLMFIEEPCPPENYKAMARIARRTTVPIATGERLVAHYSTQQLLEDGTVDILQCDINHVGGITALWKVGAMAEASGCYMAPHACEGPIGGIATLHVDAAMPNFIVQEICSGVEPTFKELLWQDWLGFPAMRMVDGYFPLPDKPGLGFEVDERALARHPFKGTKPMSRVWHEDGSVAAW